MSFSRDASATEGVAGRYIPGAYAGPGAGIVPPDARGRLLGDLERLLSWRGQRRRALRQQHDRARSEAISGRRSLPASTCPRLDLPGNWTYAVQAAIPVGWTGASAEVGPYRQRTEEVTGLGDIAIAPLLLGWHNDAMNTWFSAHLTITAPTGEWEEGALAFIGLNYWTFSPAVGFTYLVPEHGLDFSAKFGVDINTENPDTDYYSGAMAHLDLVGHQEPDARISPSARSPASSTRSRTTAARSPTPMTASRAARSRSARWSTTRRNSARTPRSTSG